MPRQSLTRWFRYRLRTLLAVTALTAAGLAGFKAYVEPFLVQRRAAEQLTAIGAIVEYRPADPAWLQILFGQWGQKHFQHVVMVKLEHRRFAPADLAPLVDLRYLERLYLASTPVDDQAMRYVAALRRLKRISLWESKITDEGLGHLKGLMELEVLDIHRAGVTEAGLEPFRGHPRLSQLLHTIRLGDAGAAALASMPRLRVEGLSCAAISDDGLRNVSRLEPMKWLQVDSPRVTDAGLVHLARMTGLERVELRNCAATDAGIVQLAAAPRLQTILINSLPISGECLPTLGELANLRGLELQNTRIRFSQVARYFGDSAISLQIGPDRMHQRGRVRTVWLNGPMDLNDVDFLEHYPNLQSLLLDRPPFALARAVSLQRLARLRTLAVNMSVDDEGAELLGGLGQLRELSLSGRQAISPAGFQQLARLKQLKVLRMHSCGLTDEHLAFLVDVTGLEILEISGNRITSAGIDHLRNLSQLRRLNVSFCLEIDDRALAKISVLERLEDLSAQDTQVTDAGLAYLFDMPYLRDVTVLGSRATRNGLRALRGALLTKAGTIY